MGRSKRNRRFFGDSAIKNNVLFQYYYNRLMGIALSLYKWENLPETVDARFLEYTLFTQGSAAFFKDDVIGYLALPFTYNGMLDVYRMPTDVNAYAINGYNMFLPVSERVLIFNDNTLNNSVMGVKLYAGRLCDLDASIDVNARAQKTPVLVRGTESQRLTLLNVYKEYDGNSPVLFGDSDVLGGEPLEVLKTDAPFVADKLFDLKTNIWNECLTYLGVPNVSIQKRERLITDEVNRTQGGVIASRFPKLDMRKRAAEEINKKFDLNVSVDFRAEFITGKEIEEGRCHGDIHDNTTQDM